jgi:hypothetical protein
MGDEQFPRDEVEAAYRAFVAAGDAGDWDHWADLHTVDCEWHECNYGVIKGRDAIKAKINELMAPVPMMQFPVEWVVIDGNRVVYYPWQVMPDPTGGEAVYRFGCITVLDYAGNGEFSRQDDMYNPAEGERVIREWMKAGGTFAAKPDALGLSDRA